jgi:MurNAc alpha-1-phosphate uridylyltransferase
MKAMLLAAGRGERMRPLTDTTPKPLLEVGGRALILHAIEKLRQAGIKELVINHAWLGEQIESVLGNGEAHKVSIHYSPEPEAALETAGGIRNALPLLGNRPFLVCNADVWTAYDFSRLPREPNGLAHLVLVDNPSHHPRGDFVLDGHDVTDNEGTRLTFSGIGVYRPELFMGDRPQREALPPLLRKAMSRQQVSGEYFSGRWYDVGTVDRLLALRKLLSDGAGANSDCV